MFSSGPARRLMEGMKEVTRRRRIVRNMQKYAKMKTTFTQ